jgi:hypothetical protein
MDKFQLFIIHDRVAKVLEQKIVVGLVGKLGVKHHSVTIKYNEF